MVVWGSAIVRGFCGSVGGSAVMRGFRGSVGGYSIVWVCVPLLNPYYRDALVHTDSLPPFLPRGFRQLPRESPSYITIETHII